MDACLSRQKSSVSHALARAKPLQKDQLQPKRWWLADLPVSFWSFILARTRIAIVMKISKSRADSTTGSRCDSPDELERWTVGIKLDFMLKTVWLNGVCRFYTKEHKRVINRLNQRRTVNKVKQKWNCLIWSLAYEEVISTATSAQPWGAYAAWWIIPSKRKTCFFHHTNSQAGFRLFLCKFL